MITVKPALMSGWLAISVMVLGSACADGVNWEKRSASSIQPSGPTVSQKVSTMNTTSPLTLRVKLSTQGAATMFDVYLTNVSRTVLKVSFGECDFSYRIVAAQRTLTFPASRPFEFASPCPGVIHVRQIAPGITTKVFSAQVPQTVLSALNTSQRRFMGEFHFRHSVVGSGKFSIAVFKQQ